MRHLVYLLAALALVANAEPREPVWSLVQKEKPALIETLRELVNIESGSHDREGLESIAGVIAKRLAALGAKVELLEPNDGVRLFDTPPFVAKVVVGRLQGTGRSRILLLAHMDTVYARGTLAKRPYRVEGSRAYGPGIADDKGGIALILHALNLLKTLNVRDYGELTVMINADEEVSSAGSRNFITRLAAEHDFALSCEATSVERDELQGTTAGLAAVTLTVRGRAAHAGVNPEFGRNALVELAHQIMQTLDLGDPSRGIKFNWTLAKAGSVRNAIPAEAIANADVRVLRIADYDGVEKALRERVKKKLIPETQVEVVFERRRPPLELTAQSRALAAKAQTLYGELGKKLLFRDVAAGGGTDAAFAALSGKPAVLEGFGLAGFGQHSPEEEYIELGSIEPRLYLLTRLIIELAQGR
jgi:glutamate carboxypeptidase